MHKTVTSVLFALILALVASASLPASTFQFTDTGAGYSISGTVAGTDNGNGSFTLISGSGFYNADPITLIAGSGYSPSGNFIFDDVLFPNSNPALDINGLLFSFANNNELNIWGTGPGAYTTYTYTPGVGYALQDASSVFTLTQSPVPEPGTLAMLAMGLALACIGGWRRKALSKA